jgi:trans-aconitate 2-methyltransferase
MEVDRQSWDAEDYARNSSAQLTWATELMAKLALKGDEALVDIGCGDGKITAELARQLTRGSVVGIDASPAMVAAAQTRFPQAQYPNLGFRQMDAACLELPATFDIAFSTSVLHWVRDHQAVLRGVRRCLRLGGRILFQMGGRGNAEEMFSIVQAMIRSPSWRDAFAGFEAPWYFYGVEDYQTWLPSCGFTPVRIELVPKDMQHDGPEQLKGWMRTTWFPYTDRLPVDRREGFVDEAVATYLRARPADEGGGTHMKMVRLEVEGVAT